MQAKTSAHKVRAVPAAAPRAWAFDPKLLLWLVLMVVGVIIVQFS